LAFRSALSGEVNAMSHIHIVLTLAMSAAIVEAQRLPRVRSESALITKTIAEGSKRSATFRHLVETIDSSDGLVYLEEGSCGFSVRACLLLNVTVAGPHRILRILVDPRKAEGCDLMESIGHELHHATELLSNRSITSAAHAFHFFHNIGKTGFERFETKDAMRAGTNVARECLATKPQ
jgi:hypothetical protein